MIVLSAFIMLVVIGMGWALEKASSNSQTRGGATVSGPAKASDPVSTTVDVRPAATDSSSKYDRSDLILSQG